ncbi:MAG: hypothetical protein N2691_05650 [Patescibacteria group bacterium]|nr:hypothetical protein [Patescibacteria group bacterium]
MNTDKMPGKVAFAATLAWICATLVFPMVNASERELVLVEGLTGTPVPTVVVTPTPVTLFLDTQVQPDRSTPTPDPTPLMIGTQLPETLSATASATPKPEVLESTSEGTLQEEIARELGLEIDPEDVLEATVSGAIKIDPDATHRCFAEEFSKEASRGAALRFMIGTRTERPLAIVKNTLSLGELPVGVEGMLKAAPSKLGQERYAADLTIHEYAQRGSFNISVFYEETDNASRSSATFCQFNLVVR